MHALSHTGHSALLPGPLALFLSYVFPVQMPFVAVQSLCSPYLEFTLWRNLTAKVIGSQFPPIVLAIIVLALVSAAKILFFLQVKSVSLSGDF